MRNTILSAAAVSAASLGLATAADAQAAKRFFFEGDLVRGAQQGAPGPFCVLNNQFKRLEKVVWRIRVLDQAGQALDDKGLKSVVVELYYNKTRTHLGLAKDAPLRSVQRSGTVITIPILSGLHHRYARI